MKIGILTHHYINNYGAFLQGYALQEAVKNLYPEDEVFIIDFINKKHDLKNTLGWFRYNPKKDSLKSYIQKIKLPGVFSNFQNKYYNLTKRVRNANEINALGLDVIIVGSDEVWNYEDIANNPVKFGYGLKVNKLLSYAPSTGKSRVDVKLPDYISEGLKNFTGLSVRDDNSEKLIKNVLGKDAVRVLDPTLLYEFPEYKSKLIDYIKAQKYVLMYYCDKLPDEIKNKIINYAKEHNYKIFGAGEYKKWFSETFVDVNPFEWIEIFRNAKIVFTGTFHGVIFSIKGKRNFYTYLTNKGRIKKVESLLKQFQINGRIISNDNYNEIFDNITEIDYETIDKNIEFYKNKSLQYLKGNIG